MYMGSVMHRRFDQVPYSFRYRLFGLLLDIDRLTRTTGSLRLLSHNRFNLFSIHDRDHGAKDGSALRPWIDRILGEAGITLNGGHVLLYCMPRVLGWGFNPLSVWYCYHSDGSLRAALCEVRNTFGEWHGYLLHDNGNPLAPVVRSQASKQFHVSPFFPVSGSYRFRLVPPGDKLVTAIQYHRDGQLTLTAVQQGERRPLTDGRLLGAAWRYPLMSFAVIAGIHWQTLKIWLRGGRFHRKPERPPEEITR